MDKIRRLILVSRPISWINTAFPFAAGYLVSGGTVSPLLIIGSVFFLIPYNLLMYGVNDVFDYESDIRNPRKGGIEGMREERALHPIILKVSLLLPLPFVVYIILRGSVTAGIVLIVVLFFVVAYSIKYLRFKERPVLDSITSSIHFVGPLVYALALNGLPAAAWPYVLAFFLWGAASHAFGAVQDIIPDREGGLSSVATVFGARTTVIFCLTLYVAASIIVALQGPGLIGTGIAGLLYAANTVPFLSIDDATSASANRGWRRFIWLNLIAGFIVTITLILNAIQ